MLPHLRTFSILLDDSWLSHTENPCLVMSPKSLLETSGMCGVVLKTFLETHGLKPIIADETDQK